MAFRDTGLTVDRTPERASGFIGNRGTDVLHEISVRCPCIRIGTGLAGSTNSGCELCDGRGRLYRDTVGMVGLVTNISTSRLWSLVSWIQPGDLLFSPAPEARRVGDFDKIRMTVPQTFDDQIITRGVVTEQSPRPIGIKVNEDALYWEAGRTEAIWIEDEDGNVYLRGDYLLDGRVIRWPGNGPAVGKQYVLKYEGYPEYISLVTPVERWDRGRDMGQRVVLRRAVLAIDAEFKKLELQLKEAVAEGNPFEGEYPYRTYGVTFDHGEEPQR